jgi:hypothetical protein
MRGFEFLFWHQRWRRQAFFYGEKCVRLATRASLHGMIYALTVGCPGLTNVYRSRNYRKAGVALKAHVRPSPLPVGYLS